MAKLVSFTLCDSINSVPASRGIVQMLVEPQLVLRPQYIPGNFSFSIALGVADLNLQTKNEIRLVITNPKKKVVYDSGANAIPIIKKDDSIPVEYQGVMMCVDIRNLPVECDGEYNISVFLNGECIAIKPIPVFRRS